MHLSSLKNLKFLSIVLHQIELFQTLFQLIAENEIPIEALWIIFSNKTDAILPSYIHLRKLNTLKHLVLNVSKLTASVQVGCHLLKT